MAAAPAGPTPDGAGVAERLEERLAELKAEYRRGEAMLADLNARRRSTREMMLRIAGAVQVLQEEAARVRGVALPVEGSTGYGHAS